ncbi:YciI family protein [Sphaerospermopsis aphanizomenoides BCCUSP55]|uniref:YciI family protein n=1 Tax=Sphaerospermopsis aphanizomenoides TaxID=459663 RepID=UPI00190392AF|nr:YciI family protein [Sphaerospermopsis aphanizomenoides]MBK1988011.1 YciI family protein [Sphaerospermopsis aphanizomenoides BCCUSP55]
MSKLFAVVVATVPNYYEYKKEHPEHDQDQLAWFQEQYAKGILLCCGPFVPHDGTGLWVIKAENVEEAHKIVNTSPRVRDGMLADSARVVEWNVHIGSDRLTQE